MTAPGVSASEFPSQRSPGPRPGRKSRRYRDGRIREDRSLDVELPQPESVLVGNLSQIRREDRQVAVGFEEHLAPAASVLVRVLQPLSQSADFPVHFFFVV